MRESDDTTTSKIKGGFVMTEKRNNSIAVYWVAFAITCAMAFTASAAEIFVDENATGPTHDGTTWCFAYLHLQDALAVASSGDVVHVADGVYRPDEGAGQTAGDRQATFALLDNVTIVGGNVGCGGSDPAEESILSGDLDDDDDIYTNQTECETNGGTWHVVLCDDIGNNADNSLHVVTYNAVAVTSPVLDGFTISGGYSNGQIMIHDQGPAIYIRTSSVCSISLLPCFDDVDCGGGGGICTAKPCIDGGPTVQNCVVKDNRSTNHGAINDHGLGSTLTSCIIRDNFSANTGGGLQVHHGETTLVSDCDFINNVTINQGGGAWTGDDRDNGTCPPESAQPTFQDCTFTGNDASEGAGLFNEQNAVSVEGCTFLANTMSSASTIHAAGGGIGMWNEDAFPLVSECVFQENIVIDSAIPSLGAGVYNLNSGGTFSNCLFQENVANTGGGAAYNDETPPLTLTQVFVNCDFIGNRACLGCGFCGVGGAVYETASSDYYNCRFIDNAAGDGGGIWGAPESTIVNSLFVDNAATCHGGGMLTGQDTQLLNCTFYGNSADQGGGLWLSSNSTGFVISNSIFRENDPDAIDGNPPVEPEVSYSNIEGWTTCPTCVGNIDADPEFIDPDGLDDILGTEDDDLRLRPGSPCIDSAENAAVPPDTFDLDDDMDVTEPVPIDLGGVARFVDDPTATDCPQAPGTCGSAPIVDMGAHEFQHCAAGAKPPELDHSAMNDGGRYMYFGQAGGPAQIVHTGYIDPRIESNNCLAVNLGLDKIAVVFTEAVFTRGSTSAGTLPGTRVGPDDFSLSVGGGTAPSIRGVHTVDDITVEITFDAIIPLQHWTTIVADVEDDDGNCIESTGNGGPGVEEPDRVDIGYLPGDVDQSQKVAPADLLLWKQYFNGIAIPPKGILDDYIDTDRDGTIDSDDLSAYRDLINGNCPATQAWAFQKMLSTQP